jgi:hypothetical protein
MLLSLTTLFATLSSVFRSRAALQLENLALRHQIGVLQRSTRKHLTLTPGDRILWVWLSGVWSGWRSALAIVQPDTVLAWHRAGFRLFWTWKVRRGKPGRPVISREVRDLIRRMCRENPSWGAPRVHGELLKLGNRHRRDQRQQIHGALSQAAVADLAHVPAESRPAAVLYRLLHCADHTFPGSLWVSGVGS